MGASTGSPVREVATDILSEMQSGSALEVRAKSLSKDTNSM